MNIPVDRVRAYAIRPYKDLILQRLFCRGRMQALDPTKSIRTVDSPLHLAMVRGFSSSLFSLTLLFFLHNDVSFASHRHSGGCIQKGVDWVLCFAFVVKAG
jgi:hypothetical protein